MPEVDPTPEVGDPKLSIIDIHRLALDTVLDSEHSVLTNAVRRLLDDMRQPGESYAAHGSSPGAAQRGDTQPPSLSRYR